jgi:hypothetical protein
MAGAISTWWLNILTTTKKKNLVSIFWSESVFNFSFIGYDATILQILDQSWSYRLITTMLFEYFSWICASKVLHVALWTSLLDFILGSYSLSKNTYIHLRKKLSVVWAGWGRFFCCKLSRAKKVVYCDERWLINLVFCDEASTANAYNKRHGTRAQCQNKSGTPTEASVYGSSVPSVFGVCVCEG